MTKQRRSPVAAGVLAGVCVLLFAAAAYSAATRHYRGRTSQHRRISFTVSGGSVRGLVFKIVDKCPHKHILIVTNSGFPPMAIKHAKFGGTFVPKAPAVATVNVDGTVSGKTVSGTLKDHSKGNKTHKFCTGQATFMLRPN